jgi:hypothetical protein
MLGDVDGAAVTIEAIARPTGAGFAKSLAERMHGNDKNVLGVGITLEVSPAGVVFDGIIGVAVAGVVSGSQDFPMKSSIPELQRRTMLFTADVLHRLLDGSF